MLCIEEDIINRKKPLKKNKIPYKFALCVIKSAEFYVDDINEDFNLDMNTVNVKTITVDEGPALKRFRARAQGRANRIKKRTSHLKIVIE